MNRQDMVPSFPLMEEIAHAVTHGLGAALSVVGLLAMLSVASLSGSTAHIVSAAVFGVSLVIMYTASTVYHGAWIQRHKHALRILDCCAIYLLIAGTYTPFAVLSVGGTTGYSMLIVIWVLAAFGILFILANRGRRHRVSMTLYVVMGWMGLVAIEPLARGVPLPGLILLVGGGLAYTIGIVFFTWRRLPYHHAIWHLFVLAGSTLHFFAVFYYVLPKSA